MKRQSNIELLRCLSVILIMTIHAGYMVFGTPTPEYIRDAPVGSFFYILNQHIASICVDVFILISGWFGIHTKLKNLGGLFFQCLFFGIGSYLFFVLNGDQPFSVHDLYASTTIPFFVICYSIMYIFTPILNSYIENTPPSQIRKFLIVFFLFSLYYGWHGNSYTGEVFHGGKSVISFIGLYILARYIRLYTNLPNLSARVSASCYFIILIGSTSFPWIIALTNVSDHLSKVLISMFPSFLSPTTMAMSVFLLLLFNKLEINSNWIIRCGKSAFASLLLHGNYSDFSQLFVDSYNSHSLSVHLLVSCLIILGFFFGAFILDQPRLWLWNRFLKIIERK